MTDTMSIIAQPAERVITPDQIRLIHEGQVILDTLRDSSLCLHRSRALIRLHDCIPSALSCMLRALVQFSGGNGAVMCNVAQSF